MGGYKDMFNIFGFGSRKLRDSRSVWLRHRVCKGVVSDRFDTLTLIFVPPFTDFSKELAICPRGIAWGKRRIYLGLGCGSGGLYHDIAMRNSGNNINV